LQRILRKTVNKLMHGLRRTLEFVSGDLGKTLNMHAFLILMSLFLHNVVTNINFICAKFRQPKLLKSASVHIGKFTLVMLHSHLVLFMCSVS